MNMRVWAVVLVAVLALTGCGGESGAGSDAGEAGAASETGAPSETAAAPAMDEWVDAALEECEAVNAARQDAEPEGDPFSPDATEETKQQGIDFLAAFGDAMHTFAGNLEQLGYPEEEPEATRRFVAAAEDSAKAFDMAAQEAEKDIAKAQPVVGRAFQSVGLVAEAGKDVGIGDLENCKREAQKPEEAAAGANEVPVIATEKGDRYTFEFDTAVPAGKTAFVMTNEGEEPHFMAIAEFTGPGALKKALAAEAKGDSDAADKFIKNEDVGGSDDAAPGEQAVANVDLKPGTYGMMCFIPGPDGQPHAFNGMAVEFTVE